MPHYEGVIINVRENGDVEAVIQPRNEGIPGAAHVNVCHSASESSMIQVEAANTVSAKVGDLVELRWEAGVLRRNAADLLAVPLSGIACGILVALLCSEWLSLSQWGSFTIAAIPCILGVLMGVVNYKRRAGENKLVVSRIISPGMGLKTSFSGQNGLRTDNNSSCGVNCDACHGRG